MPFTHAFSFPISTRPSAVQRAGAAARPAARGWGISVRMEEYFRLLGMDCPPEIRRRLDCAFYAPKDPSPERSPPDNPRFDGDCPLGAEGTGLRPAAGLRRGRAAPSICRFLSARAARGVRLRVLLLQQLRGGGGAAARPGRAP